MSYEIARIWGNCPVQAEGTINGLPFYFRARGQQWSFRVGKTPGGDPVEGKGFHYCQPYHEGGTYAAGWMEEDEARGFIDKAARLYLAYVAVAP